MKNKISKAMEYLWAILGILLFLMFVREWINSTFSQACHLMFLSMACAVMYFWRRTLRKNHE